MKFKMCEKPPQPYLAAEDHAGKCRNATCMQITHTHTHVHYAMCARSVKIWYVEISTYTHIFTLFTCRPAVKEIQTLQDTGI
jgi:hypothetical protein